MAHALVDDEDYDKVVAEGRWSRAKHGGYVYRRRSVDGKQVDVKLHRFVLGLTRGDPGVDHRDRNPLNNCKENLRLANDLENGQNKTNEGRGRSRFRGVHWNAKLQKWRAQHMLNHRHVHIGVFATEEEAGEAAATWRREHMPFSERDRV